MDKIIRTAIWFDLYPFFLNPEIKKLKDSCFLFYS